MKKILASLVILISINAFSQAIDTVYVRNLSLRAEDWYWLKGYWTPSGEEEKKLWKKMRTTLVAANPPNNTTMVTIDSINGQVALFFYKTFLQNSKGETSFMTNNISTNIKAYSPMLPYTDPVDTDFQSRFQNNRKNGKDDFNN